MSTGAANLKFPYPYEEFADHLRAMPTVRDWEYTSRFGHLGTDQTRRARGARIIDFFCDSFADWREAVYKAEVFLLIHDYLGRHAPFFIRNGVLEKHLHGGYAAEPGLLRALHYVFIAFQPPEVEPRLVLTLAKAFKQFELTER